MSTFRERLRMARRVRDITQEQLAEMAEISRAMVGRYESSDQLPALDTLVRIADALGVSTDYLLGRTDTIEQSYEPHFTPPRRKDEPGAAAGGGEPLETLIRQVTLEILKEKGLYHDQ